MEWIIMSDELEHAGKRGMHWGERNYQRKDGTWTPLGLRLRRIREGGSGSKRKPSGDAQKRAERKNEIKNLQSKAELDSARAAYKINKAQNKSAVQTAKAGAATIGNKIKDVTKKAVEAHKEKKREESVEDIVRSGDLNKILSSKTKLTEDELRTAVNRLRLEQDLKDVGAREKARGQEAFKRFSDTVSNAAKGTTAAITTYNNVAQVMNSMFGKNMKKIGWPTSPNQSSNASNTQSPVSAQSSNAQSSSNQQSSNSNQSSNNTHSSSHQQQSSTSTSSSNTQSSSHQQSSNSSQSSGNNVVGSISEASSTANERATRYTNALAKARAKYGVNSTEVSQLKEARDAARRVEDMLKFAADTEASSVLSEEQRQANRAYIMGRRQQEAAQGTFDAIRSAESIVSQLMDD